MVERIPPKRQFFYLLSSLALILAGCQTPTPLPEASDFPQAVLVQFTPGLRILQPVLETCAAEDPDLALFWEETPKPAIRLDPGVEDLTRLGLALGEPPEGSYSAALTEAQITFITHISNPVEELDSSQLRALFTGQLRSWSEVGGSELAVTPWVLTAADESRQLMEAVILGEEKVFGKARLAADPGWMRTGVAADPGAIGYLPSAWLDGSVKAIPIKPALAEALRLPLLALADREPQGAARRLLICLQTGSGQALINELFRAP